MATTPNNGKRASIRDMRTAVTSRIRSKPTVEGQCYLELYVLQRDRFRWMQLMGRAEKAIACIDIELRKLGFSPSRGRSLAATGSAGVAKASRAARGGTINLGVSAKSRRSA